MPESAPSVRLRVWPLILWLTIIGVAMCVVGVILDRVVVDNGTPHLALGIRNLIYPNSEGNLFSWYSSLILACIGIGFFLVAAAVRGTGRPIRGYLTMAAVALLLSADEAAVLHERLDKVATVLGLNSSFAYVWLLVGVPAAILVGLLLLWLARSLKPVLRGRLIVAGLVFLAGAVGGEVIGGLLAKADLGLAAATRDLLHSLSILLEESLEIIGAILGLRAVLLHMTISTGPEGLAFELAPESERWSK